MDPIANLLAAAHTAFTGGTEYFEVIWSKLILKIVVILCDKGYFTRYELIRSERQFPRLRIFLNRDLDSLHFRRISKPSLRIYMGYKEIFKKYRSSPFILVSTPKGLLDYNGVLLTKQGGEVLFISLYQ
jgi:small subunit ribosomal protein S8